MMSFLVSCGVVLNVFFIAAMLDGGLIDVLRSFLNNAKLRFDIRIIRSINPIYRLSFTAAKRG